MPQLPLNEHTTLSSSAESWHRLRLFNYYRGLLALFFITVYVNGWIQPLVAGGLFREQLFIITAAFYLLTGLLFIPAIIHRKPSLETQIIVHTLVDLCCIILLMHATGGVRTGLGMLVVISISMTSLLLRYRITILFAAIAAVAIIGEQIYAQFIYAGYNPAFTQAGLLGILIFISALLTTYSARRLKESEKLAEQTSQELEAIVQMNEHIISSMRTGIIVIQNTGRILMANNAALELLGNIKIETGKIGAGTNIKEVSQELYNRFMDWQNNTVQNQLPVQQKQGLPDLQPGFSRIDQNDTLQEKPEGRTLIFIEDATQLAQRFQQVKLASLGRLTASIAHEIRNPLAAINHAGQLLGESSTDVADKKLTGIINTQVKRLNGIVENVLQLSRQQRGRAEAINLYQWLLRFREEFIATYKLQAYQIPLRISPDDISVIFDVGQLHQVMWNLCANAINHSGMELSNIMIIIQGTIDEHNRQPYIDIIDNGRGIDEDTRSHIFEPFFTTSAEGTGLGLYITKEVLESNRAKIQYLSPQTGGTCFRIYFQQSR